MSYKWARVSIAQSPIEIIDGDRGKNYPHQNEFFDDDFCLFLNAGNVTKAGFNFEKPQFITKEKDRLLNKGKLRRGDIVLTTRGTVGNSALYDDNIPFDNVRINSGMVIFRNNDSRIIDNEYFYYFLKSSDFLIQVFSHSSGSAQPQLPIKDLRNIKFPLPPLSTQFQISEFISAFDKKIELNHKTNQTLEEIAHAIFKEWFVDFNYPGATGELVNSPLGPIPEGWEIKTLRDLTSLKNGVNYSRGEKGDREFPIVNVRNIVEKKFLHSSDLDTIALMANKAHDYYLSENDILMARSASPGEVTIMYGDLTDVVYSGFVIRVRINEPSLKNLIFRNLLNDKEKLLFLSNGTTLKSINQEVLNNYSVLIPDRSTISKFNSYYDIFKKEIINNLEEIKTLSLARDALLRRFFDGQRK